MVEPVSPALERVKLMLFNPFDLGKWFVIGFCAWLAYLGKGGGSAGFHGPSGGGHGGENFRHDFEQAKNFILGNLEWIIPLAAFLVVICLGLWLLFLWLSSRGKFMFLHCVALNKAEVSEPWRRFAQEGNSLFLFRLGLGLLGWVLTLPMAALIAVMIYRMVQHGGPDVAGILGAVGLGLALIGLAMVLALIGKLTTDFVVPDHVSAAQPVSGGLARVVRVAGVKPGSVHPVSSVLDRAGHGDRHDRPGGHARDVLFLLFDAPAIHRHGDTAAGLDVQTMLFALLSRAVRAGIRRVPACCRRAAAVRLAAGNVTAGSLTAQNGGNPQRSGIGEVGDNLVESVHHARQAVVVHLVRHVRRRVVMCVAEGRGVRDHQRRITGLPERPVIRPTDAGQHAGQRAAFRGK